MSETSLYERIGGQETIDSLIPAFYSRVLADPELAPFFKDTSMEKLHHMQRQFFTMALGGPTTYTGRPLAHAHHGLGIRAQHFGRFVSHLVETLRDIDVPPEDTDGVIAHIDTLANEITGASY